MRVQSIDSEELKLFKNLIFDRFSKLHESQFLVNNFWLWIEKVFIFYEKNMVRLLAFQLILILSLRLLPFLENRI